MITDNIEKTNVFFNEKFNKERQELEKRFEEQRQKHINSFVQNEKKRII